ncbi:uncharacterized protein LOC124945235 isoform X2 [Impatiens glandulifera]|uniref:uncharacterized protein LOC124945235 isoform X2 n=1 Tax=Impatiens glandulifera TaxID=253017 RepID=UPI001FB0DB9C|nr:uncharacterized protein LOC124945235 isoform X2 [Impatiens glandulifera]
MAAASVSSSFSLCTSSPSVSSSSAKLRAISLPFNRLIKRSIICFSKSKRSFGDQILDYIEGGPKLRKWYGAPDLLPKDGAVTESDERSEEEDEVRDAILVTDGDNDIGQLVILALIVKRVRVKAVVKDRRAALEAFGTYVEAISGDVSDSSFQNKALRGVRTIICPSEGFLAKIKNLKGVQHLVLLSQLSVYRRSSGIQALINSNARKLAEQDESIAMASGIPYTIIKAGSLKNVPGGNLGFSFKENSAEMGSLSKEDAATICAAAALDAVPKSSFVFEVANGDDQKVSDWKELFATLLVKADEQTLSDIKGMSKCSCVYIQFLLEN